MTKILFLGDVHVQVSNLEESERLLSFTQESADKNDVDFIMIPGDLYHTFAIKRTEVDYFWQKWLNRLSLDREVNVLVGNHDKVNQGNDSDLRHALNTLAHQEQSNLNIIQSPVSSGIFGFMPYFHSKEKFVEEANKLADQGVKVIFCHGEFNGGKFESGMFIPDGINPDDVKVPLIISGHIHSRQRFDKIIYPGTARWLTSSDKNEPKGLWLAEFDEEGKILKEEFLDTSHVCTPIYAYQFKEGEEEPTIPTGSRASVELIGSSEWVSKQKAKFKGIASVSSKITDKTKPANRKTGNSLEHFVNKVFEPMSGIKKERMVEFMKELGVL